MISRITGNLIQKNDSYVVLETGGVGYKIFVSGNTEEKIPKSGSVTLWTHLAIRENSHDLYGFLSLEDKDFFELLITVSGIGPKTALNILNIVSADTLRHAIFSENAGELVKISGIGRKTAEKIFLELRGKLIAPEGEVGVSFKEEGDAIEALTSLGYKEKDARDVLKKVPGEIVGTSERVRHALKMLSTK